MPRRREKTKTYDSMWGCWVTWKTGETGWAWSDDHIFKDDDGRKHPIRSNAIFTHARRDIMYLVWAWRCLSHVASAVSRTAEIPRGG